MPDQAGQASDRPVGAEFVQGHVVGNKRAKCSSRPDHEVAMVPTRRKAISEGYRHTLRPSRLEIGYEDQDTPQHVSYRPGVAGSSGTAIAFLFKVKARSMKFTA